LAAGKGRGTAEKPIVAKPPMMAGMVAQAKKEDDSHCAIGPAQRTSSVTLCQGKKKLTTRRQLGELNLVKRLMGAMTHGAGELPSPTPSRLVRRRTWIGNMARNAPKEAFGPAHLRLAGAVAGRSYGAGVDGDLLVHLSSGMRSSWASMMARKTRSAFGGIYHFKDGRGTCGREPVLFEYGNIPVYCG